MQFGNFTINVPRFCCSFPLVLLAEELQPPDKTVQWGSRGQLHGTANTKKLSAEVLQAFPCKLTAELCELQVRQRQHQAQLRAQPSFPEAASMERCHRWAPVCSRAAQRWHEFPASTKWQSHLLPICSLVSAPQFCWCWKDLCKKKITYQRQPYLSSC